MITEIRSVTTAQGVISYCLTRKRVRNLNMHIDSKGMICVSASPRVAVSDIDKFVESRSAQLLKAYESFSKRKSKRLLPESFCSGEKVSVLGQQKLLKLALGKHNDIYVSGDYLIIELKDIQNKRKAIQLFNQYQKITLDIAIQDSFSRIYPLYKDMGVKYPTIGYRNMSSRWGSCIPQRGKVNFSLMLFGVPQELIDYVVAHELTHFLVPNHSNKFYAILTSTMPDCIQRRRMLKDY